MYCIKLQATLSIVVAGESNLSKTHPLLLMVVASAALPWTSVVL